MVYDCLFTVGFGFLLLLLGVICVLLFAGSGYCCLGCLALFVYSVVWVVTCGCGSEFLLVGG